MTKLFNPRTRIILAWTLLIGAIIGWRLIQLTVAKDGPPFIFALSWLALVLTSIDILSTQDVRDKQ